jgi:hypothetical protein
LIISLAVFVHPAHLAHHVHLVRAFNLMPAHLAILATLAFLWLDRFRYSYPRY